MEHINNIAENRNSHEISRGLSLLIGLLVLVELIIFKVVYPSPNFIPDSYSYIAAAYHNMQINIWPIGYSKFLRLLSSFTHSDYVLVSLQYLMLQCSILYFLNTVKRLVNIEGRLSIFLYIALFNPLSLYIANLVSSDAIFTALSFTWFTQLLLLSYQFDIKTIVFHSFVLLFAFSFRYNGLIYPVISTVVILMARKIPYYKKAVAVAMVVGLTGWFCISTVSEYKHVSKQAQFSAFGGWQLASNALYMYSHVKPEPLNKVPGQFKALHEIVNRHMDSLETIRRRPDSALGIYYLWDEKAPLKRYLARRWERDTTTDFFVKYASMGKVFGMYGAWLIKKYPLAFVKYFILRNFKNYYVPPPEFLQTYNMQRDSVDAFGKIWFDWKGSKVKVPKRDYGLILVELAPIVYALINCAFFLSCIGFLILNGVSKWTNLHSFLTLAFLIWICNLIFSVVASPIVLRYELFPMTVCLVVTVIVLESIIKDNLGSKSVSDKQ